MMEFFKYKHLERFGAGGVTDGLERGITYVFPKLDGTNGSIWFDGEYCAGSRNRLLSEGRDNAGFFNWLNKNQEAENYRRLVKEYPNLVFFGEWLVPHSLKTYREDAWRKFYIFDVYNRTTEEYLHYEDYVNTLRSYQVEWLAPLAIINNATMQDYLTCMERNFYLIKDGQGVGEGIVIKNYGWTNRFGQEVFGKLVTNAFKEKHHQEMGAPIIGGACFEETLAIFYTTAHLVEKTKAKIENEKGWSNKCIPELLNRVWYDIITEEMWTILKDNKNPKIDFGVFQRFVIQEVKKLLPEVFGGAK